jgi:hypothetical protein
MLVPSALPSMEYKKQYFSTVRKVEGATLTSQNLENVSWEIPANAHVKILLDQGFLTNAFPKIIFQKEKIPKSA